MFRNIVIGATLGVSMFMAGCASVPMAPGEQDGAAKKFEAPTDGTAGLYIYRNTFGGQALKKTVSIDGEVIGETANRVYFYKKILPGEHTLATESEFSDNEIKFTAEAGKNYFFEQYIKWGVFVGGAALNAVNESEGIAGVNQCKLAQGN